MEQVDSVTSVPPWTRRSSECDGQLYAYSTSLGRDKLSVSRACIEFTGYELTALFMLQ